jgi:hypothetical protein
MMRNRVIVFPDPSRLEREEMHEVVKGDTISGIARSYGLTVRQLRELNPRLDSINEGQIIFIPVYSKEPGLIFERDISAFALQYQAKMRAVANEMTEEYWQKYLNNLVSQYQERNLVFVGESEQLERI